jgi:hypothetical protein
MVDLRNNTAEEKDRAELLRWAAEKAQAMEQERVAKEGNEPYQEPSGPRIDEGSARTRDGKALHLTVIDRTQPHPDGELEACDLDDNLKATLAGVDSEGLQTVEEIAKASGQDPKEVQSNLKLLLRASLVQQTQLRQGTVYCREEKVPAANTGELERLKGRPRFSDEGGDD